MQAKFTQRAFLSILAVGLALLAMMVLTEGEPGALPLALTLIGVVGYAVTRLRLKRAVGNDSTT